MNVIGLRTLTYKEIKRSLRTPTQTFVAPVISTALYFIIFGEAIGSRIGDIDSISYAAYMMPGLIMMNVLTTSFMGMAFGIMFPRVIGKTINDVLVAPLSYLEITIGFAIGSVLRSVTVGLLIFLTSLLFISPQVEHPVFLILYLILVATAFSLFGFIIGLWAKTFEQLSTFPTFVLTPLSFLGGVFYSIDMLPPFAQGISLYNPIFYLVNGLRFGFYGVADVSPVTAVAVALGLAGLFLAIVWRLLSIGYNLKT